MINKPLNGVSLPTIKQRSNTFAPCRRKPDGTMQYGYVFLDSEYNQEILDWVEETPGVDIQSHQEGLIKFYSIVFENEDLISFYKLKFL